MSRTKNASRNIIWGVVNKCVMLFMPFLTRTVMIHVLGVQYIGLGSLFTSILQVLSFAELGIGEALVFSMYEPMAKKDTMKVNSLLAYYKKCYIIIGTVILSLGLLIMPFLKYIVKGDIPSDINIYKLFAIFLCNNVIGYYMFAYKSSILTASQRNDLKSKIGTILHLVANISQIIILIMFKSYYMYIIIVPIITFINNLLISICVDKNYPEYVAEGVIDNEEKSIITQKIKGMIFQKIGNVVLVSVDSIVISAFLGLDILGIYNNYYYVVTTLFAFLSVITQSLIPSVGNSMVTESQEKNYADFCKFHLGYTWIVVWWSVCLLCLIQDFMKLWIGGKYILSMGFVICLVVYFFINKWLDMVYVYREAQGLWWEARIVPLTASIINLILNLILVNWIGLIGILLSTILSMIFVYDVGGLYVMKKYVFKDMDIIAFIIRQIKIILQLCIIACSTYCLCTFFEGYGIISFIIKCIISVIAPNIMLFFIYRKNADFCSLKDYGISMMQNIKEKYYK